ncbi:hypothetical protein GCM10027093_74430 [Paraburkholderia jirisanensis]
MLIALLLTYAAALPVSLAVVTVPSVAFDGPGFEKHGLGSMILFGCLIAPMLETAVNQWACIRLLNRFGCRTAIAIVISALLFGLGHTYSVAYVLTTFIIGLVLAATFVIEDHRGGSPFLVTMMVHATRNGITTLYYALVA